MTVKEVKKKIEKLKRQEENMTKLQEYFLGHCQSPPNELRAALEEAADLSMPIGDLCSSVAFILGAEIKRLEDLIDNAVIN